MVNVCAAAPAVAEDGARPVILGTGFDVGGAEEFPPPPPPHDREIAKQSATRIEIITRSIKGVLEITAFVSCDTVGYLTREFLGTDPHQDKAERCGDNGGLGSKQARGTHERFRSTTIGKMHGVW
jgi:hypothetical protein